MRDLSDWDLVERAREGDSDAFAEIVSRYQKPVVHFCKRMIRSHEDAEDIAQESFVRVFRYLDRISPAAKFSTLLLGIARNLTLNFLRDTGRRGRGITFSLTNENNQDRQIEDGTLRPDRIARLGEIDQAILDAMGKLSDEHREVLVLRELQGMDYSSIAEVVRCRKGTVKSRIARAREQLRLHLERAGGQEL